MTQPIMDKRIEQLVEQVADLIEQLVEQVADLMELHNRLVKEGKIPAYKLMGLESPPFPLPRGRFT